MGKIKLKSLLKEQPKKKSSITLMDIIEDVVGIESSILDLKKRLKELIPSVEKDGHKEVDPNFFGDDPNDGVYHDEDDKPKYEKDTEFDHLDKRGKEEYQSFLKRFPNHELTSSIKFELEFLGKDIKEIPPK